MVLHLYASIPCVISSRGLDRNTSTIRVILSAFPLLHKCIRTSGLPSPQPLPPHNIIASSVPLFYHFRRQYFLFLLLFLPIAFRNLLLDNIT